MKIFFTLRMVLHHPFFVLLIFCIYLSNANGQSIPKNLESAFEKTKQLKIKESNVLLENVIKAHPFHFLLDDYNDILKLLIDENPSDFDDFETKMENRLDQLEEISDKNSPWFKLVKAEIKFHWGIVNYKYGNELTAIWNINQSHSLIKDNQKKFPEFTPNLKTLGIFHVVIGAMPDNYQWIMEKIGFKGDVNLGLKELEMCSQSKNVFQFESKIIKTYIDAHLLNKYEVAISAFEDNYEKTNNLALHYLLVSLYSNTHQSEKALNLIIKKPKNIAYPNFEFYHFKLASCYFQKGEYQKSIEEFNVFLKKYKGQNYLKSTYHKLALAHYFLDEKEQQNTAFNNINNFGWKISDEDKYAQKFYENAVFPNKSLAKARYLSDGGYFEKALIELKNKAFSSSEEIEELNYRYGRIYDLKGNNDKALVYYKKASIDKDKNQTYYAPNACLKAAIILINSDNKEEAKKLLKKAIAYKNHEYENSIEMKAKSLLKTIDN